MLNLPAAAAPTAAAAPAARKGGRHYCGGVVVETGRLSSHSPGPPSPSPHPSFDCTVGICRSRGGCGGWWGTSRTATTVCGATSVDPLFRNIPERVKGWDGIMDDIGKVLTRRDLVWYLYLRGCAHPWHSPFAFPVGGKESALCKQWTAQPRTEGLVEV